MIKHNCPPSSLGGVIAPLSIKANRRTKAAPERAVFVAEPGESWMALHAGCHPKPLPVGRERLPRLLTALSPCNWQLVDVKFAVRLDREQWRTRQTLRLAGPISFI